ncbi:MAG: hypothetical protein HZA14_12760 [Nitrospirae bacterium]|nr:hypothetical protein [Nitrospirota bacterium]
MKKIFTAILLILLIGCAGQRLMSLEGMPSGVPTETVKIKGDNCKWIPDLVRVKKGSHVILEVESVDWDYNFRLVGYDLRFKIPKGQKVTGEFYASQTGEFEYGCYIEKGFHYFWGGMVGKLIVE